MANTEIRNQFSGLPMDELIGAPLSAACDAQVKLASATAGFIQTVGYDNKGNIRNIDFKYEKQIPKEDGEYESQNMKITTPILTIVKIPSLAITDVEDRKSVV